MMKVVPVIFAVLLSATAFAQQPQGGQSQSKPQNFQERKQHVLERIDQRIARLQTMKGCVEQAQDKSAMRTCFPEREKRSEGKQ